WSGRPQTDDLWGWLAAGACGLHARQLAVLQPLALLLPFRWRTRVGAGAATLALDNLPCLGSAGREKGKATVLVLLPMQA
ncbi:unnamed protein product, partial [Urochloa humidicola]